MAVVIQTVDGVVVNRFEVKNDGLKFGRAVDNDILIDDSAISSHHAEIIREEKAPGKFSYSIQDLGSTNGTFVNEKQVGKARLHHKDEIRVGWNIFTFIDEDESDMEKTDKIKKSWIPGVYIKDQ